MGVAALNRFPREAVDLHTWRFLGWVRQSQGWPDLLMVLVLLQAGGWTEWPPEVSSKQHLCESVGISMISQLRLLHGHVSTVNLAWSYYFFTGLCCNAQRQWVVKGQCKGLVTLYFCGGISCEENHLFSVSRFGPSPAATTQFLLPLWNLPHRTKTLPQANNIECSPFGGYNGYCSHLPHKQLSEEPHKIQAIYKAK